MGFVCENEYIEKYLNSTKTIKYNILTDAQYRDVLKQWKKTFEDIFLIFLSIKIWMDH